MKLISTIILALLLLSACSDFVELDAPKTQIVTTAVFENDAGAQGAIVGIYAQMMREVALASGGANGVTALAGLSADELDNHSPSQGRIAIYNNSLTPVNTVSSLWNNSYLYIYQANSILEGANKSTQISKATRDEVLGEALFIRAFSYFYLVNFFGDVPLLLSTDYRVNRLAARTLVSEVYEQIEKDLLKAQGLLLDDYSFSLGEKVRPNRWAATALLSRVYLYQKKWDKAESQASLIIESNKFPLADDLNSVFLANSTEAIWQLMPTAPGYNTYDGPYFIVTTNTNDVTATSFVTDAFEPGDNRANSWIGSYESDENTYNYVNKYKIKSIGEPLTEYQMVLRSAEQYLIRAEARAMQDNLLDAVDDVNTIRIRAGLDPIDGSGLSQSDVMVAIEEERRTELFIEWGHRWFDLKRWGTIDAVLGPVKADWQSTDALFPIPQSEIDANPNLVQNP
jgi:hypothetical protein